MILYSEGTNKKEEADAHMVLTLLTQAYPGHPWWVRVEGGCIFIRHLLFGKNWGMNVKFKHVNHDAAVFKKEIIMKAGEWLERAGLARGREDGSDILKVEGIPDKDQPITRH